MRISAEQRLAMHKKPPSSPLMQQTWENLLFMHWPVPASELQAFIPAPLEVDTFDDTGWVALTPFAMRNVRPSFVPPIPWLSDFYEINCRTYVHLNGEPGVWFFSLDTDSAITVLGARTFYSLPYYGATFDVKQQNGETEYRMNRKNGNASFTASWKVQDAQPRTAEPDTLEFFQVERYCLYTVHLNQVYRSCIWHEPWPLRGAELQSCETNLLEANRLEHPATPPRVHLAGPVDVSVWPLEKLAA
jgi:uncharacterized protein YqjF (DUF2071 family)